MMTTSEDWDLLIEQLKEISERNVLLWERINEYRAIEDFVEYCNEQPRTSRADHLDSLIISYIHMKNGVEEE